MKEIGGYIELDLPVNQGHLHPQALRINTAGNVFRLILEQGDVRRVFMPNYICDSMIKPLHDMKTQHTFYTIDEHLEPTSLPDLRDDERFLFVNYFGLKDDTVARLAKRYGHRLIVDNSQALFSSPLPGIDTLYSPRKFVGVADGAYWYPRQDSAESLAAGLPVATSWQGIAHLAGRLEEGASRHYADYVGHEKWLDQAPVLRMSRLSEMILCALDYESYRERRRDNFRYLHDRLSPINGMKFDLSQDAVPMVYPLMPSRNVAGKRVGKGIGKAVRESLRNKMMYLPRYWPDVVRRPTASLYEMSLVDELLALPIDHRYRQEDMAYVADCVEEFLS